MVEINYIFTTKD